MVSGWWLSLPLVGNIQLIMVNDDGYYIVNDDYIIIIWLVVEPYPSEKYEFVSWDDGIPNMNGKIKIMFQTTNQYIYIYINEMDYNHSY